MAFSQKQRLFEGKELYQNRGLKKKEFQPEPKKEKPVNEGRRLLLKTLLVTLTSGAISYVGANKLKDWIIEQREVGKKEDGDVIKEDIVTKKPETNKPTEESYSEKQLDLEKEKESEQEEMSLKELISFNSKEKIVLDELKIEKLKNYWKNKYQGSLKQGLETAWKKMGFWEKATKEAFLLSAKQYCEKKGFNKQKKELFLKDFADFFYLAIPESHWDVWADSGFAKGPFQFTAITGFKYGLKKRENYDERTDPEKSAGAAAKCLLDMYEAMGKDWNLVLSGYNGSFIWQYEKSRRGSGKELSYGDFLVYLGEKIEEIKKEALWTKTLFHKIKANETWESLAEKYACEKKELQALNKKYQKKGLIAGEKVLLPANLKTRERYFYRQISGFSENINYPAKFLAVIELLRERREQNNLPQKETRPLFVTKKIFRQPQGYKKIKTFLQDKPAFIASKYGISVNELKKINKVKTEKALLGKNILVPSEKISLFSLAGGNRGLLEVLHKLNPAIQDLRKPIPNGLEITMFSLSDYLVAKK